MAIEFGSDRSDTNFDVKLATFKNLAAAKGGMVHGLRAYGSAALNLCSVASGYLDAYWEGGCWEWDVCAGWVILEEAGGVMVEGNAPEKEIDDNEVLSKPDLCGRVYFGVRKGHGDGETEKFIKRFWSLIEGKLFYGR